jgi:hypothetical protein
MPDKNPISLKQNSIVVPSIPGPDSDAKYCGHAEIDSHILII